MIDSLTDGRRDGADIDAALLGMDRITREQAEDIGESARMLLGSGLREQAVRLVTGAVDRAVDHRVRALLIIMAVRLGIEEPARDRIEAAIDGYPEDAARLDELCAIVSAAVDAARVELVEDIFAATAKQWSDRELQTLSSRLLAEGYAEVSVQVLVAKARCASAVSTLYLMDMLRASERARDAESLFVRVLAADPPRARAMLYALYSMGRIRQADHLFAAVGRHSCEAGMRLCLELADLPHEYTAATARGLAAHRVEEVLDVASIVAAGSEKNLLQAVLRRRRPDDVAAAVDRLDGTRSADRVELLMAAYAHAPLPSVLGCAVILVQTGFFSSALTLLGEFAANAGTDDLISAASQLAGADTAAFRALVFAFFTRSQPLEDVLDVLRRTRQLHAAVGHLRDLAAVLTADQLADLCSNLVEQGADDLCHEVVPAVTSRADFAELIATMHGRGRHRIAYWLSGRY